MRVKSFITAGLIAFIFFTVSVRAVATANNNEEAIHFKADSGESTDAFQGFIMVPENRKNPESRQIRVNYVRFPSTSKNPGSPIVYLAGGPGGSGIATAKWRRFPLFMAMREYGDVIALDQRGTSQSQQEETCVSEQKIGLTEQVSDAEITLRYRQAGTECLAFWKAKGVDVYGYTTEQNAWDIDDLRRHLKAEKVALWGISYGSHLALAALKQFPERIDKVILASVEGLDQTVKLPAYTNAYFERVQDILLQQETEQKITDLTAMMRRVHDKLQKSPLRLSVPQKNGTASHILFQRYHMQMLASRAIADPGAYLGMLVQLYQGLDNDDHELLTYVLQRGFFNEEYISFRLMPLAMDVASGVSEARLNIIKQQSQNALLGQYLNFPMPALNNLDPALDLGDEFRTDPDADNPVLVFTGSLDGRTYPAEQRKAVSRLSNATQINVINAGHNLYTSSPEVLERMRAFMAGFLVSDSDIVLPVPQLKLQP